MTTPLPTSRSLRVALVHDYVREYGGAERVVEALHELFPDAPLYTAFVDPDAMGIHWQKFQNWTIYESWLTRIPFYKKLYSPLRVLAAHFFQSFDLSGYDLVISSSNAYLAKAVRVPAGAVHICYCHTPPRSLYGYTTMSNWQANPLFKVGGTLINHFMRVIDVKVAQEVHVFVANSQETAHRIKKFYRRDSTVIYPPVALVDNMTQTQQKKVLPLSERSYYLYVNRLALAKHPELAVQVCSELQLPLKVVGTGAMLSRLQAAAGPSVEFLGAVSDEQLATLYAGAKALIYPVEDEDFGIVPVEAMAFGVPVIAHNSGGPRETVVSGKTGILFDELNFIGLKKAVASCEMVDFDVLKIAAHAQSFRSDIFKQNIIKLIEQRLGHHADKT